MTEFVVTIAIAVEAESEEDAEREVRAAAEKEWGSAGFAVLTSEAG